MKNFLYVLIGLLLSIVTCMAQERYEIQCKTNVNVREKPLVNSTILGTLNNGEVVSGYGIDSGWAQIIYKNTTGYVHADYVKVLSLVSETAETTKQGNVKHYLAKYSSYVDTLEHTNLLWLMAPILLLSLLLYGLRVVSEKEKNESFDFMMKCLSGVALVLSLCELVMLSGNQLFDAFFDWPWYGMIVGFILFVAVTLNQIFGLILYTGYYSNGSMKIGILTFPVAFVAGVVCSFIRFPEEWVTAILLIGMLIQAGIIVYHTSRCIGFIWGIVHALIFVIFAIATTLIFVQLLSMLFILFIILGFFKAIGSRSSSSDSISDLPTTLTHPYTGRTLTRFNDFDNYMDLEGNEYEYGMWNKPSRTKPKL